MKIVLHVVMLFLCTEGFAIGSFEYTNRLTTSLFRRSDDHQESAFYVKKATHEQSKEHHSKVSPIDRHDKGLASSSREERVTRHRARAELQPSHHEGRYHDKVSHETVREKRKAYESTSGSHGHKDEPGTPHQHSEGVRVSRSTMEDVARRGKAILGQYVLTHEDRRRKTDTQADIVQQTSKGHHRHDSKAEPMRKAQAKPTLQRTRSDVRRSKPAKTASRSKPSLPQNDSTALGTNPVTAALPLMLMSTGANGGY